MRIGRIGPITQPIPAVEYGGTQRSMAQMTAFQASICGHDVTLYGPEDSGIISFTEQVATDLGFKYEILHHGKSIVVFNNDGRQGRVTLKANGFPHTGYNDPKEIAKHQQLLDVFLRDERQCPYDIIHCHAFRLIDMGVGSRGLASKTIAHQHNEDFEDGSYTEDVRLVCISKSQAKRMKQDYGVHAFDVIYHGLSPSAYRPTRQHAGYLAWIARIVEEKGAHRAIDIAKAAGKPLIMAGVVFDRNPKSAAHFDAVRQKIDVIDENFLTKIRDMTPSQVQEEIKKVETNTGIKNPVIFCGPADEVQKQTLYGNALATLFPISWPEPFGRVMIESMACGTPVIGNASLNGMLCGSVEEIIENGVTGYSVHARDESDALQKSVQAISMVASLCRDRVRSAFNENWTSIINARRLNDAYERCLLSLARPEIYRNCGDMAATTTSAPAF